MNTVRNSGKYTYVDDRGVKTTKRITPDEKDLLDVGFYSQMLAIVLIDQNYRQEVNTYVSSMKKLQNPYFFQGKQRRGEHTEFDKEVFGHLISNGAMKGDNKAYSVYKKMLQGENMFRDKTDHLDRLRVYLQQQLIALRKKRGKTLDDADKVKELMNRINSIETQD